MILRQVDPGILLWGASLHVMLHKRVHLRSLAASDLSLSASKTPLRLHIDKNVFSLAYDDYMR